MGVTIWFHLTSDKWLFPLAWSDKWAVEIFLECWICLASIDWGNKIQKRKRSSPGGVHVGILKYIYIYKKQIKLISKVRHLFFSFSRTATVTIWQHARQISRRVYLTRDDMFPRGSISVSDDWRENDTVTYAWQI